LSACSIQSGRHRWLIEWFAFDAVSASALLKTLRSTD
jgi:hypothetical protein